MVALTEMFVTGYQTQDLILKPAFVTAAISAVEALARCLRRWPGAGDRRAGADGRAALQRLLRAARRQAYMRGC
jgi:hypothetical protein